MKKFLFPVLTVMMLYSFNDCHAQIKIGAKAGFTFAGQVYDNRNDDFNPGKLAGIMVGGVAEYILTDQFRLASGLSLENKGYKYNDEGFVYKLSMNYLTIPIQVQYHRDGFYGGLGFYMGFALGAKFVDEDGDKDKLDLGNSTDDDLSGSDFGMILEGGYDFTDCLRGSLSLGFGLSNIIPAEAKEIYDDIVKNNIISLQVTYFFHEM